MATEAEIFDQVDLLADGYGRSFKEDSRHYEAYCVALSDIGPGYIKRAVVSLLRDRLQYMPTPAEVRAHAKSAIDYDNRREEIESNRRLVCGRCLDYGFLETVNRRWLGEFQDNFDAAFFVRGWLQQARRWCREEFKEPFNVFVVCGCECRKSKMFEQQIERWKASRDDPSIKAPHPAFMNVYSEEWDVILVCGPVEGQNTEDDYRDLLLATVPMDNRTWTGNWRP